jgi:hypothetical protein
MKRGEISMEVIIVAAIALLVLVILTILVIRSGGNLGKECQNVGGSCQSGDECPSGTSRSGNSCPGEGQICCVQVFREQ